MKTVIRVNPANPVKRDTKDLKENLGRRVLQAIPVFAERSVPLVPRVRGDHLVTSVAAVVKVKTDHKVLVDLLVR